MKLDTIELIERVLPPEVAFPYFADRESAWVLAQVMTCDASVPALRQGDAGKLVNRPVLRELVARCGGTLRHNDVLALAHADKLALWSEVSKAGQSALDAVFASPWENYTLSFTDWGDRRSWRYDQVSRPGSNLVIQLGFPQAHAQIFGRFFTREMRKKLEYDAHPIRTIGPPTVAWARVDLDLETGTALIEEVQSDWLRLLSREKRRRIRQGAQMREMRVLNVYEETLTARYAKTWPRVMLFATLYMLREELGVRDVWMHRPDTGAKLKGIGRRQPPRSLYTDLPRSFAFEGTRQPPPFLSDKRRRHLTELAKKPGPLFWRLSM